MTGRRVRGPGPADRGSRPRLLVVPDAAALAEAGADWLAARIATAIHRGRRCTVALAGGRTPRPIYERLAAPPHRHRLPWGRILLLFGDERCVPPDDPASNYRMAREALAPLLGPRPSAGDAAIGDAAAGDVTAGSTPAGNVAAAGGGIAAMTGPSGGLWPELRRIEAERADADAAAADYDAAAPAVLDIVVLGMGAEGHTASLFPGSPALRERKRGYVAVAAPVAPRRRITVTPPRLAAAGEILVVAAGADKAAAAARALEGDLDVAACPAQLARRGTWLLDAAAASRLSRRGEEHGA